MYKIEYHKKVLKDIQKIKQSKLENKAKQLIELLKEIMGLIKKKFFMEMNIK